MTRATVDFDRVRLRAQQESEQKRKRTDRYVSVGCAVHDAWTRDFPNGVPLFVENRLRAGAESLDSDEINSQVAQIINHSIHGTSGVNLLDAGHYSDTAYAPGLIRIVTDYPDHYTTFPAKRREVARQNSVALSFLKNMRRQLDAEAMTGGVPTDWILFIDAPVTGRAVYEDAFEAESNYWTHDDKNGVYWLRPGTKSSGSKPLLDAIIQMEGAKHIVGVPQGSVPLLNTVAYKGGSEEPDLHLVRTPLLNGESPAQKARMRAVYDARATEYIIGQVNRARGMNEEVGREARVMGIHFSDGLETACLRQYLAAAKKDGVDVLSLYVPRR